MVLLSNVCLLACRERIGYADSDGFLDLYVCNYADWDFANNRYCGDQGRGIRMYCSPTLFPPAKDILYHNRGDGAFDDASEKFGINKIGRISRE